MLMIFDMMIFHWLLPQGQIFLLDETCTASVHKIFCLKSILSGRAVHDSVNNLFMVFNFGSVWQ